MKESPWNGPPAGARSEEAITSFRAKVWEHYRTAARPMPWRSNTDPYWILVSEIMLQQTQVPRVLNHFPRFVERFPSLRDLSEASLFAVVETWQGLGYNRRARFLHQTAGIIVREHDGVLPDEPDTLVTFPGIGRNTAGSIVAFAYNRPVVFIETNIRRAVLHEFFPDEQDVPDARVMPVVAQSLDVERPREWYWAFMDYGAFVKSVVENPNRRSREYQRQAPFRESNREARGAILRVLTDRGMVAAEEVPSFTGLSAERISRALSTLVRDGLVRRDDDGKLRIGD